MATNEYYEGIGSIVSQFGFEKTAISKENYYKLPPDKGNGYIYQLHHDEGFFIVMADYTLYEPAEIIYKIQETWMEIYYFESGDILNVENGKKSHQIQPGINIYINKEKTGRIHNGANTPVKYISIILFDKFLEHYMKTKFPEEHFNMSEAFRWKNHNYNTPELIFIFLQLKQNLKSNQKMRMYYESKIGEIISLIMNNYRKDMEFHSSAKERVNPQDFKYLQLVKTHLDTNFLNPPTMKQLCSLSNMGATKLKKAFKNVFGITICSYLREVRMKHALLLLTDDDLNIYNVASSVGYKSTGKFSIAFKKIYGMTPSKYRSSLKLNVLPEESRKIK